MRSLWTEDKDNLPLSEISQHLPGVDVDAWISCAKTSVYGHHPYSGYRVGAAGLSSEGHFRFGTNVEDASFGGTICAERTSITRMVSEGLLGGGKELIGMALYTEPKSTPCGHCFSMMLEFMPDSGTFAIVSLDQSSSRLQVLNIEALRSLIWSRKFIRT
jgi:cytidine deaminase